MKFTSANISTLKSVMAACNLSDITSVVISEGKVRGVNEARTCAIIAPLDDLADFKMGITNLKTLKTRMDLFENANIESKENNRGEATIIEIVDAKSAKNKIQYRCTMLSLIKAPVAINDPIQYAFSLSQLDLQMIMAGVKAMGTKRVCVAIKNDGSVNIEANDVSHDVFALSLENNATFMNPDEVENSVVFYYDTDTLFPILRANSGNSEIFIGQKGTITTLSNDCQLYIFSKIDGE